MSDYTEQEQRTLSVDRIILELGESVFNHIERKVIYLLRCNKDTSIKAVSCGLKSVWNAYCAQQQSEKFDEWELYENMVMKSFQQEINGLFQYELEALYIFAVNEGCSTLPNSLSELKVDKEQMLMRLTDNINKTALNWTNKRLERYHKLNHI